MKLFIRNWILSICFMFVLIPVGVAFSQGNADFGNARALNRQEVIDLIANKTIRYHVTVGSRTASAINVETMKISFSKTDDYAGNLSAFTNGSSSSGKWHVNENSRLVRQYDNVRWGSKPFTVGVFENKGKFYWKIGEEFQELISIE